MIPHSLFSISSYIMGVSMGPTSVSTSLTFIGRSIIPVVEQYVRYAIFYVFTQSSSMGIIVSTNTAYYSTTIYGSAVTILSGLASALIRGFY